MPYHHVLIAVEPEPEKLIVALTDLSRDELQTRFVRPYKKGTNLVCGNSIFPVAGIRRVHIVRTEQDDKAERAAISQRSIDEIQELNRDPRGPLFLSLGRGYDPEDILENGEDVTTSFINGPPGHAAGLLRFINNQWFMLVATGLIVAFVVWWFGWQ